jgi:hypothetical protein
VSVLGFRVQIIVDGNGGKEHSNRVEVRVGNDPSISPQDHFIGRSCCSITFVCLFMQEESCAPLLTIQQQHLCSAQFVKVIRVHTASLFRHLPVTDRMFGKYVSFQKLTKIEEESEDQIGFGEIEMLTGEENWRLIIP